jgi:hypothetical protein
LNTFISLLAAVPDWFRVELGNVKLLSVLARGMPAVPARVKEWGTHVFCQFFLGLLRTLLRRGPYWQSACAKRTLSDFGDLLYFKRKADKLHHHSYSKIRPSRDLYAIFKFVDLDVLIEL